LRGFIVFSNCVAAGNIAKPGNRNLLIISILKINGLRQIAGGYAAALGLIAWEPVALVDFFACSCKKFSVNGSLGSLHGIKMHICAFLFDFALKRNKLLGDAAFLRGRCGRCSGRYRAWGYGITA
jgi:hypothetical protein